MFLEPSDLFFILLVLMIAWMAIEYFDGPGGGRRIQLPQPIRG